VAKGEDGTFVTSLKALIPAALTGVSPVKGKSWLLIFRCDPLTEIILGDMDSKLFMNTDMGTVKIGTVREFWKGEFPPTLALAAADKCILYQKDNHLVCQFEWKDTKRRSVVCALARAK
jgi:hypothetical protein